MVGPTVSMFDIDMFLVCQLMGPVIFPRKTYLGIWVSFLWGPVSFQLFDEKLYGTLSPPFPPTSRAQSSELPSNLPRGIINAQAISRFLGLELKCS